MTADPTKVFDRVNSFLKNRAIPGFKFETWAPKIDTKEDIMKKGYWVVAYRSISDESAVKAYGQLAVPAVRSFGGRFLTASTSRIQTYEAGLQERVIIVEFDSYDIALAAYKSEAYQKALVALGSGAERDLRIVEGM
jgi:uncharacterized protein (DUF1330 family)